MEFKQLTEGDTGSFVSLIKDMYGHLENLEWFSPMPYDEEGVRDILKNPRFFVLGCFDGKKLCAVSSFDFKCGKLIGQSCLPQNFTLENTAEIGFTMVASSYRGQGIMKKLIAQLEKQGAAINKKFLFGKVHIKNMASYKSFLGCGFNEVSRFGRTVKREEFEQFLPSGLLSEQTKARAQESLRVNKGDIAVEYAILAKQL